MNLGAGVQSTTVYLLALDGKIESFDYAIFADTQEEPAAVYTHLEWLQSLKGPKILIRTVGKLGDDLARGVNSTGQRFASIPAFTAPDHDKRSVLTGCDKGQVQRQCTREYKIEVVEKTIRKEILKVKHRGRVPKGIKVTQVFGISADERVRANRIRKRLRDVYWAADPDFPLLTLGWVRGKCKSWLEGRVPHETPRSACVFCPYKSNAEWRHLRDGDKDGWRRAVEIDNALRIEGNIVNRGLDQSLYIHRDCIPLDMVDLGKETMGFHKFHCDEGMCGV